MILKRIKKAWELSKLPEIQEADSIFISKDEKLYEIEAGDGKAEFFGEGTVEEYERQKEADKGFIKKVFGL